MSAIVNLGPCDAQGRGRRLRARRARGHVKLTHSGGQRGALDRSKITPLAPRFCNYTRTAVCCIETTTHCPSRSFWRRCLTNPGLGLLSLSECCAGRKIRHETSASCVCSMLAALKQLTAHLSSAFLPHAQKHCSCAWPPTALSVAESTVQRTAAASPSVRPILCGGYLCL